MHDVDQDHAPSIWIDIPVIATDQRKKTRAGKAVECGDVIAPTGGLIFRSLLAGGPPFAHDSHIGWRITITDPSVMFAGCGRSACCSSEKFRGP